jgi:NAD(P)-dependent dehydrogenase (short-subunit alcohol dehydrogenase family)
MEIADFDAVMATNLRGVWLMARAEVRVMLEHRRRGSIINISSFVAQAPNAGSSVYAASKAGVDAMIRALALEVGPHGIRVSTAVSLFPG